MIDRIADLALFARIAACGSLSAASRELGLSLGTVSGRLSALEKSVGLRLVNRSTRTLRLTPEGEAFLAGGRRILDAVGALEDSMTVGSQAVGGRLRITASAAFSRRHIAPLIGTFRRLHPALRIELIASDRTVDLIAEGFDLAIRQSQLPDSTLIVRTLVPNRRVACASPGYLARAGTPASPQELACHDCIVMGVPPMTRWSFEDPTGEMMQINVVPSFTTNDGDAAHQATLADAGIALKSRIDVVEDIAAGRLVELFPGWRSPGSEIQAVFPAGEPPPKLRTVLDLLAVELMRKAMIEEPQ